MVYLILHKFAKLAKFAEFAEFAIVLANSSLASLKDFRKWPFWQVLEFAKIGEFSASTRIRQIRRRVAIACFLFNMFPFLFQIINF